MDLTVLRTLGSGPYAEVGRPTLTAAGPGGDLLAIAGELGSLDWPGDATALRSKGYRVGVYRSSVCERLVQPDWEVRSLAFHPELPLLLIGGGDRGELVLDLGTGEVSDALGNQLPSSAEAVPGLEWSERTRVWAIECLSDGRILAALDGRELECWRADGELEWEIIEGSSGRQIVVTADELTAWVCSEWPDDYGTSKDLVLLATGQIIDQVEDNESSTMTSAAGWIALRDTGRKTHALTFVDPAGQVAEGPELTGFDPADHPFVIRRATGFLFLQGDPEDSWHDKWVAAVDLRSSMVQRLFPLDWQGTRQLSGGPGLMLDGDLIHAGTVHSSAGLQPGGAFVVRRSLSDGSPRWLFTADAPITAIDELNTTLYVGMASGALVALDAGSGQVRWRTELTLGGQPAVPLSLATGAPDRLVIGTTDGRIADCRV